MLFKNETICMVVGIAGIIYFVITIVGFIYCKIRNITCCHQPHQESRTEFKMEREKGYRESVVCGDQDPALQRYVKNPKADTKLRAKDSDEQGEPKYDYAVTGEFKCTGNESQKSRTEKSSNQIEENTSKNETETTKKAAEPALIEVKRKEKTNANRPIKQTGTLHYENATVEISLNKANNDVENESVSDTSYVPMRTKDASDLYENEDANGSSNERHGNESNVYESIHGFSTKMMTVVDIDIEGNNDDSMVDNDISDSTSHTKLNTGRENVPASNNNYTYHREKEHAESLEKRDSIDKRESQGSGQSNESRKSDESEESNDSNNSKSTDISVRSDNTDISGPFDNTPRESTTTNPSQDSSATYINVKAKYVQIGSSSTIVHMHTDNLIVKS